MNNKNSDRLKRIRKFIIKTLCLPIIPFEFGKKIRQLLIRGIFLDGVKTFVSLLHNKNKTKYYLTVAACCKDEGIFDTNHYDDEFFKAHDINEVEDANLMQPYIEEIKKNIAKINRKLS